MNDYGNQYSGSAGMPVKEIVVAIVLVIAIITGTVFSIGVDIAIGGNNKTAPASAESTTAAADDDKSALADDNEEEKPNNTDLSDLNLNSINDLTADNHKIKCRDNLNDYGKKIYDDLYQAVSREKNFEFTDNQPYSEERASLLGDIFNQLLSSFVLTDHPEIFWTQGGLESLATPAGNSTQYDISINYDCDKSKIKQYKKEIESKVAEIIGQMPSTGKYEQAVWIHDYIVRNTVYNNEQAWATGKEKDFGASIYALLIKNESNCNGYSKMYKYFMDIIGVPCAVIIGTCTNGERHAWNIVEFGGEYYQLDATWDDPVGGEQKLHHNYFCITDEEMYKSRVADDYVSSPICNANTYNYYVYNKLLFSDISDSAFEQALQFYKNNKLDQIEFKFSSAQATERAVAYAENGTALSKVLSENGYGNNLSYTYYAYDDTNVVEIGIK